MEATPQTETTAPVTNTLADPCAGGTVAHAVYTGGTSFSGSSTATSVTVGAPLAVTLSVDGPCESASGVLDDGFVLTDEIPSEPRYFYGTVDEILRYPLSPTAPLPSFAATIAGQTRTGTEILHFGCWPGFSCSRTP